MAADRLTFEDVVARVASRPKPLLVVIDGLSLSGKSTLALQLMNEPGAKCVGLDASFNPRRSGSSGTGHPSRLITSATMTSSSPFAPFTQPRCSFRPYD
jgi:hypothetical protein